ncbi:PQQ-binding-like beta-propeller repeat protein [Fuerstiella marisgermanici]|uniref:Outer membrane biogenesis protein n=1 Tax=Fuerstiella marisgermanici TaxID=1891926 RepID=A0A1P8WDE9_9PLAN|nr:PQQ-binding-like beta-propeller repeat protein [Fuerstiella marisgermanici]APZ92082.1 outer membrane biogenesis protein [Fuerstiella marisgermanici]
MSQVEPQNPPSTPASPPVRQPAVPRKMLLLTGMAVSIIVFAFAFNSQIEDMLSIGLDTVMFASAIGVMLLLLLWVGWFMIFSRWKWWQRLSASAIAMALPFAFLAIFRPVNGGDATFVRLEPIWAARPEVPPADIELTDASVDLLTETPQDFPRFLGPDQNGIVATDFVIDADQFSDMEPLWRQPIGKGWAGFVARNGFAVTMEQRQDQECVTCYEIETGKLQWMYQHAARHRDAMNMGRTGPRSTPTIFDGKVYAVGAVGNFVCLNGSDGTVAWQVDLNELLGLEIASMPDSEGLDVHYESNSKLAWGRSGSPLIFGDLVIVPGGGPTEGDKSTLLAFDRNSGSLVWRSGDEMIAYGSPVLATVAGVEQILLTGETKVMGFRPDNGEMLWSWPRPGKSDGYANTSQVTVVNDNQVLASKGYSDGGGLLITLHDEGDSVRPEKEWFNTRSLKTKLTSPVVYEGHAYSLSNGFLECARLTDGDRIWKARGRFGHGQILLVNDQLLIHGESGSLYLVNPTPEAYDKLGECSTIDGVCWNTLCLYGNRLLVRSELEAACFELPVK